MDSYDKVPIIIDLGSSSTKVGYSESKHPINEGINGALSDKGEKLYGDAADISKGKKVEIMGRGWCMDWDFLPGYWFYLLNNVLRVDPTQSSVLLTDFVQNTEDRRTYYAALLFETLQVPSISIRLAPVCSLYATGKVTGLVFEQGDQVTQIVGVKEGKVIPETVLRLDFGGKDLSSIFKSKLEETGTKIDLRIVKSLKEKKCFVAQDYSAEYNSIQSNQYVYELPDGTAFDYSDCVISVTEKMWLGGLDGELSSPEEMIFQQIQKSGSEKLSLYSNIILAGGNTMFNGYADRIQRGLGTLLASGVKTKVVADVNRAYASFTGAQILTQLNSMEWVSKKDYDEKGMDYINQKGLLV